MVDRDPIDADRTTRPRAGLVVKDRREAPGVVLIVVAAVMLVGCFTAAAMHSTGWVIGLGVIALVAAVCGFGWILIGRRRTAGRDDRVQP